MTSWLPRTRIGRRRRFGSFNTAATNVAVILELGEIVAALEIEAMHFASITAPASQRAGP